MKIVCPHCGEVCETACEIRIGQHVICPFCKVKFSYGADSVSPVATSARKSIKFDFERCERELSDKWNGRGRRRKKKLNKWWIVVLGVGVLANLVFLVFGLPICLDEWQTRKAEERARQGKLLEEHEYSRLRRWYKDQLRYNGLAEVTMGTGWDGAGGFILTLTDGSMDHIILDYSTRVDRLMYPRGRIQPGFAMELVQARIKIAEYEAKHKH